MACLTIHKRSVTKSVFKCFRPTSTSTNTKQGGNAKTHNIYNRPFVKRQ